MMVKPLDFTIISHHATKISHRGHGALITDVSYAMRALDGYRSDWQRQQDEKTDLAQV